MSTRAPLHITSAANPKLKEIAALALKKNREETGLFVAEGLQTLTYAREEKWHFETLLFTPEEKHTLLKPLEELAKNTLTVPGHLLEKLTRRENAQTVLAVLKQQWLDLGKLKVAAGELVVALDRVRDPGNLGTIIRTCDAAGVKAVVLIDDCTDPYAPEGVRATMGSLFHVPLVKCTTAEFIEWKQSINGLEVYGTHLKGNVDYRKVAENSGKARVLLMGNEQQGLTEKLASSCDYRVKIPMMGKLESLNLATATAVMLYEMQRDILK